MQIALNFFASVFVPWLARHDSISLGGLIKQGLHFNNLLLAKVRHNKYSINPRFLAFAHTNESKQCYGVSTLSCNSMLHIKFSIPCQAYRQTKETSIVSSMPCYKNVQCMIRFEVFWLEVVYYSSMQRNKCFNNSLTRWKLLGGLLIVMLSVSSKALDSSGLSTSKKFRPFVKLAGYY